jgi:hypothetical protein
VIWRFLQGFQEAVGGLGGHPVCLEDDGDLAPAHEGAHLEFLFERAGLLDAQAAGLGLGLGGVDIGMAQAFGGFGDEAGKVLGEAALAAAAGTGEEIGVGQPFLGMGAAEEIEGCVCGEGHGGVEGRSSYRQFAGVGNIAGMKGPDLRMLQRDEGDSTAVVIDEFHLERFASSMHQHGRADVALLQLMLR